MRDVVVVGGGHNGLCCAAYLARTGLDVFVLERRSVLGGACSTEELVPGHRFSTCAYALHLLHERVIDDLGLEIEVDEPAERRALLPDGSEIRGDDVEPWEPYAHAWEQVLLDDEARLDDDPTSIVDLIERAWGSAPERCAYAPRYFDGSADERGSALAYGYVETGRYRRVRGIPRGGMGAVAAAFATAARDAGVEVELCAEVMRVDRRRVLLAAGRTIEARAVVSNADPVRTAELAHVTPPSVAPGAGAKLHVALREPVADEPGLIHVYRELDWYARCHAEPDCGVAEIQLYGGEPSVTVYLPFARAETDARGLAWAALDRALPTARRLAYAEVLHDAREVERRVGLSGARIHHLPHSRAFQLERRPRTIGGVHLCGAGSHPGGEVSGVPGLLAAQRVLREFG